MENAIPIQLSKTYRVGLRQGNRPDLTPNILNRKGIPHSKRLFILSFFPEFEVAGHILRQIYRFSIFIKKNVTKI